MKFAGSTSEFEYILGQLGGVASSRKINGGIQYKFESEFINWFPKLYEYEVLGQPERVNHLIEALHKLIDEYVPF